MYCAIEGLAKTIERYPTAELSEQPIRTALALLGRRELMPPFDGYTQILNRAHERIKKAGATNLLPVVCATRSTSPTGARRLA